MGSEFERGSTLAETALAAAIVATVVGAALAAVANSLHVASAQPARAALQQAVQREMRIALDILKYRGATIPPRSIATALPMPNGAPMPARLSVFSAAQADGSIVVTVTATASENSRMQQSLSARLAAQAPLPGSRVVAPGLAPAPTGAP